MPDPDLAEPLTWSVRPCTRNPALAVAVAVFVLTVSFGLRVLCGSLGWGLLALALLSLSVASYYTQTRYELSAESAVARGLFGTHRRVWSEVRGRFADREGILLSPLAKPSRLAYTRGLYLRFGDNREEVLKRVEALVASAGGDPGGAGGGSSCDGRGAD
jgi:hypothetical protein